MAQKTSDEKSCETQLFGAEEPTPEWTVEQLGDYARTQHELIVDRERSLAIGYWKLGGALEILRGRFKRGEWGKYLDKLEIDRTRASRARAIRRCFPSGEELQGLTVAEAYARRQRKPGRPRGGEGKPDDDLGDHKHALVDFVQEVNEKAAAMFDEAAFADGEEALTLLPLVEDTIRLLEGIRDQLRKRAREQKPA